MLCRYVCNTRCSNKPKNLFYFIYFIASLYETPKSKIIKTMPLFAIHLILILNTFEVEFGYYFLICKNQVKVWLLHNLRNEITLTVNGFKN